MEDILASIRRIIADDDGAKPAAKGPEPVPAAPKPVPPAPKPVAAAPEPPEPAAMSQDDIDAMLAGFDTAPPAPEPSAPAEEPEEVLELTAAMEAPRTRDTFRTIEPATDVVFSEPAAAPARSFAPSAPAAPAPAPAAQSTPEPFDMDEELPLLSQQATTAVTSAFGSLAHTVLAQNARTLDDLVREMLRPMLKAWLDDNLPTIVERQVRAEIERVSRGRG